MVRVLLLSTAFVVQVQGQQVPVVQSDKPLWAKGKEWRVEARPLVDIGAVEAEPMYEFSDVIGVLRLGDGRVAVANMASGEIRFYDRTGKFLHAAGRKGAGPGEFKQLMGIRPLPNDTIVADDSRDRLLVFSGDGRYVREMRTGGRERSPVGWFSDGSWVGWNPMLRQSPDKTGEWVDSTEFARYAPSGEKLNSFGRLPFVRQARTGRYSSPVEFSARPSMAVGNNHFYHNHSDDYEIDVYDATGKLVKRIRRAWTPIPVEKIDLDRYHDAFVNAPGESGGSTPEFKQFREGRFKEMVFSKTFPAHGQMVFDRAGNLWVAETQRPTGEVMSNRFATPGRQPRNWSVFDPQGRWLGQVQTPARFFVFDIGADYIAGKYLDEFDVEHVRVYALTKPR
jgi:hypothetical protein